MCYALDSEALEGLRGLSGNLSGSLIYLYLDLSFCDALENGDFQMIFLEISGLKNLQTVKLWLIGKNSLDFSIHIIRLQENRHQSPPETPTQKPPKAHRAHTLAR